MIVRILYHLLKRNFRAGGILAFAVFFISAQGFAASPDESYLLELINAARQDPLGMARQIGLDRSQVLKDWPDQKDLLVSGLPALSLNESLCRSAKAHTADMLVNNYYAYEGLDGRGPEDRMQAQGYPAAYSGETLGMLFFNNFIKSGQAVFRLFANMYRDELDPERAEQWNILNPDPSEIGICISSGVFRFPRFSGNVYMVTCDFGKQIKVPELELMELINQARANPKPVAQDDGFKVWEVVDALPDLNDLFLNGLPPLTLNRHLYDEAEDAVLKTLEDEDFGYTPTIEDGTIESRLKEDGYDALWAAETCVTLNFNADDAIPPDAASEVFDRLFSGAFRTDWRRDMTLFSDQAREIGIQSIARLFPEKQFVCGDYVRTTVLCYGAADDPDANPALVGVVFDDLNGNGLFDSGEGISGAVVTIGEAGAKSPFLSIATNPAGGFSADLKPGKYKISASVIKDSGDDDIENRWVEMDQENKWVAFKFTDIQQEE